jgi:choline-sulfatase
MLRQGRWKLIHYVGFAPELFDLATDPEEATNRSADAPGVLAAMMAELAAICDPEATNAQAFADQATLIERYGGRDAALRLGAPGATPPPAVAP